MAKPVTLVHDKLKALDGSNKPREITVSARRARVLEREAKGWKRKGETKSEPKSSEQPSSSGSQASQSG